MSISLRHLIGLGLHLLAFSPAVNLAAQAPDAHHPSPTAALPRFTLREIVAGTNDSVSRIPGPWLGAALAVRPESLARAHYHQAARLSGIVPLGPKALVSDRSHHIMGLYRRQELTAAARRTLTAIRQTIPLDSTRSRFDFLFRLRGRVGGGPARRPQWRSSDRILRPLQARWPLLALGELEKRAAQANQREDQHLIGHALVLALVSATRNPAATTRLLLQHAEHPSEIAKQPALLRAWRRHARVPDRVLPGSRVKFLMPEVTFTVEDGFPDVITSRIIVPSNRKVER